MVLWLVGLTWQAGSAPTQDDLAVSSAVRGGVEMVTTPLVKVCGCEWLYIAVYPLSIEDEPRLLNIEYPAI